MNLSKTDYKIIKFVKKKQPVHIDDIQNRFKNVDVLSLLVSLRKHTYLRSTYKTINLYDGVISEDQHIYTVTEKGLNALNEYEENNTLFLKKSLWFPLIIAAAGALLTFLITKCF